MDRQIPQPHPPKRAACCHATRPWRRNGRVHIAGSGMLVCIAAERCLHDRLGPQVTQHIAGFRHVDDGVVIGCCEDLALYMCTYTCTHRVYTAVKTAVYAACPTGIICETADGHIIDILAHRGSSSTRLTSTYFSA